MEVKLSTIKYLITNIFDNSVKTKYTKPKYLLSEEEET